MNVDLGSPIIDIAVGLSFVFFLLSLIASAVGEFFAGVFNLRGKTLLKGIKGMVGDEEIAEEVFRHPLVRTNGIKGTKTGLFARLRNIERKPAYVSASNFAHALLAVASEHRRRITPAESGEPSPDFLWQQLDALGVRALRVEAEADLGKIEKWFNDSMDRVSGWYKRRAQWITIVTAVIVAVGLNANTVRIAERLDQEPSTRAAVVAAAEKAVSDGTAAAESQPQQQQKLKEEEEGKEPPPAAVSEIQRAGERFSAASKEVAALNLPLFWSKANSLSSIAWWKTVVGLLLSVIAISLGAPFWFDTLGKLANLRTAGRKPRAAR